MGNPRSRKEGIEPRGRVSKASKSSTRQLRARSRNSNNQALIPSQAPQLPSQPIVQATQEKLIYGFFDGTKMNGYLWGQGTQSLRRAIERRHAAKNTDIMVDQVDGPGDQSNLLASFLDLIHGFSMKSKARAAAERYSAEIAAANAQGKSVRIVLTGWSRGAASLLLVAQMLQALQPQGNYHIELNLIDPCVGPTQNSVFPWTVPNNVSALTIFTAQDEERAIFPAPEKIVIQNPQYTKVNAYRMPGQHASCVENSDPARVKRNAATITLRIIWDHMTRGTVFHDDKEQLDLKTSTYNASGNKTDFIIKVNTKNDLNYLSSMIEAYKKANVGMENLKNSKNEQDTTFIKLLFNKIEEFSHIANQVKNQNTRTKFVNTSGITIAKNVCNFGELDKIFSYAMPYTFRLMATGNFGNNVALSINKIKAEINYLVETNNYDTLTLIFKRNKNHHLNEILKHIKIDGHSINPAVVEEASLNKENESIIKYKNKERNNLFSYKTLSNGSLFSAQETWSRRAHYAKIASENNANQIKALIEDYTKFTLNPKTWNRTYRSEVKDILKDFGHDEKALYNAMIGFMHKKLKEDKISASSSLYARIKTTERVFAQGNATTAFRAC